MSDTQNMRLPYLKNYYREDLPDSALVMVPNGLLKELVKPVLASTEATEGVR